MSGAVFTAGISFPRVLSGGGPRMSMAVAPPPARTLYEVLRVREAATAVEIKAAYRSMAKLCHPDVAPAGKKGPDFVEIHRAYVIPQQAEQTIAEELTDEEVKAPETKENRSEEIEVEVENLVEEGEKSSQNGENTEATKEAEGNRRAEKQGKAEGENTEEGSSGENRRRRARRKPERFKDFEM